MVAEEARVRRHTGFRSFTYHPGHSGHSAQMAEKSSPGCMGSRSVARESGCDRVRQESAPSQGGWLSRQGDLCRVRYLAGSVARIRRASGALCATRQDCLLP
ncbi:hypothetical protein D3C84_963710 [compost metagenome]